MHTFFNPDREGWLWKQGGRYKSWKRRWFILNDNCLYYFEFTTDKEPRGIIPLENIRVREVTERSKQHCFELFSANNEVIKACKTDSEGKVVEGNFLHFQTKRPLTRDPDFQKILTPPMVEALVRLLVNLAQNFIVIFVATVVVFQKCFYAVKGYGVTR